MIEIGETHDRQKNFAVTLVRSASATERDALASWLEKLLAIRKSAYSVAQKIKQTLAATKEHKILWPLLKIISSEAKKNLWDNRSTKGRLGVLGVSTGILFFGGQSAGIAALGGAVGLPLWIVLGAGATFAGYVLDEIHKNTFRHKDDVITVEYEVID